MGQELLCLIRAPFQLLFDLDSCCGHELNGVSGFGHGRVRAVADALGVRWLSRPRVRECGGVRAGDELASSDQFRGRLGRSFDGL